MKQLVLLILSVLFSTQFFAQENILITNPVLAEILRGNYEYETYAATDILDHPDQIVPLIQEQINADSLKNSLIKLNSFYNRNSGSDTLSATVGIGAARNWILSKFDQYSAANENRLVTGFLQFDQFICGMSRHKNVLAALPGTSETGDIIIIEAHMDSRCEEPCGIDCEARGMEDNGSGTALVIELARVMSQFTFDKTILFVTTTAEEQGLFGAEALSFYCKFQEELIQVKATLNNDVVGGIICGETSSEPSCPGENLIDSTQVRIFSRGSFNSKHKSLARYSKLQYQQELLPYVQVPMAITLMSAEDRTGRGGDHIPFGIKGLAAIRYTSAHEHGDAGIDDDYHDRQHTSQDILGQDNDGDGVLDSFFVDFNYLARNTRINAVSSAMIAMSPEPIEFEAEWIENNLKITIEDENDYLNYAIGLRSTGNDWDSIYYFTGTKDIQFDPGLDVDKVRASVASVNENEVESCFSAEKTINMVVGIVEQEPSKLPVELWQNAPNPFDEATTIIAYVQRPITYKKSVIIIYNEAGKYVRELPITLLEGANEVLYRHGYGAQGIYSYSLVIDGEIIDTKSMVFAN